MDSAGRFFCSQLSSLTYKSGSDWPLTGAAEVMGSCVSHPPLGWPQRVLQAITDIKGKSRITGVLLCKAWLESGLPNSRNKSHTDNEAEGKYMSSFDQ